MPDCYDLLELGARAVWFLKQFFLFFSCLKSKVHGFQLVQHTHGSEKEEMHLRSLLTYLS